MKPDAESPLTATPWGPFVARVTATHVIAYFAAGLVALTTMQYEERFAADSMATLMRPFDDPLVAAGAGLQVINGLALGLVLVPFRGVLLGSRGALHQAPQASSARTSGIPIRPARSRACASAGRAARSRR